jgi:tRNA pseudouridine55 synthase
VTTALADIPALAVTAEEAARLHQGQAISLVDLMGRVPREADPEGGLLRAMAGERLLGLCRLENGWMQPERLIQLDSGQLTADVA